MILVSACLWGRRTRYDGRHSLAAEVARACGDQQALCLCPEMLGGLPTPRPPARIQGARPGREGEDVLAGRAKIIDTTGRDVSAMFIAGARRVLEQALAAGVGVAYLKDRSPSCAHDPLGQNPGGGPGQGVLTALLLAHGVRVIEVRAIARDD